MAEDFAKLTASPVPIVIQGVQYLVGKFSRRDLGDLQAWIKSQVPDPRLMAREICAGLSDAVAIRVWEDLSREAELWPPFLDTNVILRHLLNDVPEQSARARALQVWLNSDPHWEFCSCFSSCRW